MKILWILFFLLTSLYSISKENQLSFSKEVNLDELYQLSPTSNIVVLQRRYLPRTGRLDLSPSTVFILNSEFIIYAGLGGHIGFSFLEKHGFELRGFYSTYAKRSVTHNLERIAFQLDNIEARTIATLLFVYKWIPVYGKMSWFNDHIIPFETYIIVGGGSSFNRSCNQTTLNRQCQVTQQWSGTTLIGLGQSYAISRNVAIYWDITHQYYGEFTQPPHHTDIVLQMGLSLFVPTLQRKR